MCAGCKSVVLRVRCCPAVAVYVRVCAACHGAVADADVRLIYACNPVALPAAPAVPGAFLKLLEVRKGRHLFSPKFEAFARCSDWMVGQWSSECEISNSCA